MTRSLREVNDLSTKEAALEYVARGWHVLPLWWVLDEVDDAGEHVCACPDGRACTVQGKHPLVKNGHHDATDDADQVRDWWRRWPRANVGVNCQRSGFFALDVDAGKVMPEQWPPFASGQETVPETLIQLTGRTDTPGHHVLFSTRGLDGLRVRGHVRAPGAPGVDKILIKHNGLIVVSPSRHKSGRQYQWITDAEVADPGPVITPLCTVADRGDAAERERGADGMTYSQATSFADLMRIAVEEVIAGKARSQAGSDFACQLRDNGCSRKDAELVWLPGFYREVLGIRPNPPDPDSPRRWATAYDTPARDPLPAFDRTGADLGAAFAAGARAAAATGDGTPTAGGRVFANDHRDVIQCTDLGNSMRFARIHRDRVRYVADMSEWRIWNGRRWQPDVGDQVLYLTVDVINEIRDEAEQTQDARLQQWATQSESIRHRKAMVEGARVDPALVTLADDYDVDPLQLVVENGTIELDSIVGHDPTTWVIRESRPEDLNSNLAAVWYDPTAECPRWRDHIAFISNGNRNIAAYLNRAVGYSLTGLTTEQAFFFLYGAEAQNGKNTFIEPITSMLGTYAIERPGTLLTGDDRQHPTIWADLVGKRFVFVDETNAGRRINEEVIKNLTGAQKTSARRMHQDFFSFTNMFKVWIAGNDRPRARSETGKEGLWRRIHEIPCDAVVGRDVKRIEDFARQLYREEASGILVLALHGLADWRERGAARGTYGYLDKPLEVEMAIAEHREEYDYLGQFVDECLETNAGPEYWLTSAELYEEYERWCQPQQIRGQDYLKKIEFGKQIAKKLGYTTENIRDGKTVAKSWKGIKWSDGASAIARTMTQYNKGTGVI